MPPLARWLLERLNAFSGRVSDKQLIAATFAGISVIAVSAGVFVLPWMFDGVRSMKAFHRPGITPPAEVPAPAAYEPQSYAQRPTTTGAAMEALPQADAAGAAPAGPAATLAPAARAAALSPLPDGAALRGKTLRTPGAVSNAISGASSAGSTAQAYDPNPGRSSRFVVSAGADPGSNRTLSAAGIGSTARSGPLGSRGRGGAFSAATGLSGSPGRSGGGLGSQRNPGSASASDASRPTDQAAPTVGPPMLLPPSKRGLDTTGADKAPPPTPAGQQITWAGPTMPPGTAVSGSGSSSDPFPVPPSSFGGPESNNVVVGAALDYLAPPVGHPWRHINPNTGDDTWVNWCLGLVNSIVRDAFGGRRDPQLAIDTARNAYYAMRAAGRIRTGTIPPGSAVFWPDVYYAGGEESPFGHIATYVGNGMIVTNSWEGMPVPGYPRAVKLSIAQQGLGPPAGYATLP